MAKRFHSLLVVLAAAVAPPAAAGASGDLAWKVESQDFVHYRVVEQEIEDSDDQTAYGRRPDAADLHGFYGYELDAERRAVARPVTREPWLAVPFVFRLPPARAGRGATVEIDERVAETWRMGAVRARGRLVALETREAEGRREVDVSGLVRFSPEAGVLSVYRTLATGSLTWTATFDLDLGLMTRISYDLTARSGQGQQELPRGVHTLVAGERRYHARVVLALDRRYEHRWPGFRGAVDRAIDRACEWIERDQGTDGGFHGIQRWGTTGLALLALVRSGRPVTRPAIQRGFAWLLTQPPKGTYETGAVLMALEAWGTPEEELLRARRGELGAPLPRTLSPQAKAYAQRCVDYLMSNAMGAEPAGAGPGRPVTGRDRLLRWGYPFTYDMNLEPEIRDWWDNSNTQYAVLGLHSAARCGVEIPRGTWNGVAEHFLGVQAREGEAVPRLVLEPHGPARKDADDKGKRYAPSAVEARARGWGYRECHGPSSVYGSMTGAGIASLAIARAHLDDPGARSPAGLRPRIDAAIRDGWAALAETWTVFENPRFEGWYPYHLYGLERAGILCDVATVQGHDWYWEGAMQLVLRQEKEGRWPAFTSDPCDTLWALLFLSRSTTPVTPR